MKNLKAIIVVMLMVLVITSCTKTKYVDLDAEEERVLTVDLNQQLKVSWDSIKVLKDSIANLNVNIDKKGKGMVGLGKQITDLNKTITKLSEDNELLTVKLRHTEETLSNSEDKYKVLEAKYNKNISWYKADRKKNKADYVKFAKIIESKYSSYIPIDIQQTYNKAMGRIFYIKEFYYTSIPNEISGDIDTDVCDIKK